MKRSLSLTVMSVLLISIASFTFASESFKISGNPNGPPVSWEENGELKGCAPALASSIFSLLNIKYRFASSGNWKNAQELARSGEVDMLVAAYRNNEREKYLLFSEPFLIQPIVVVVKKGQEFKLSRWTDLIGKKGVINAGESYGEDLDRFISSKLDVDFVPFERAIQRIVRDEADFMIIDLYTALVYQGFLHGQDAVSVLEPALSVQAFHFAINRNSELASHLETINEKIRAKKDSGEITNLLLAQFDRWRHLTAQRSAYLEAHRQGQAEQQKDYLKTQKEFTRRRIIETMAQRDGLPQAAQ